MAKEKQPVLLQLGCPGGTLYTIRPGDSFFTLAPRFNTTVEALITVNPGVSPTNLVIGQQICIPVPPEPGPCPGGFPYFVVAGDTFFSLAQRFGIAVQALAAANPGINPNSLRIGEQLCIPAPAPGPSPGTCPGGFSYTIRPGDTLFALATRFGTTVAAIETANPGINPNNLQVGTNICIPVGPGQISCPGMTYTIRAGDTYFSIAQRFNTTVSALTAANPGVDPDTLRVGQRICIPPS